jgi:hypothetical protein
MRSPGPWTKVRSTGRARCRRCGDRDAQTGQKLDRATDQDELLGKGPLEKAGKSVDDTVKEV